MPSPSFEPDVPPPISDGKVGQHPDRYADLSGCFVLVLHSQISHYRGATGQLRRHDHDGHKILNVDFHFRLSI